MTTIKIKNIEFEVTATEVAVKGKLWTLELTLEGIKSNDYNFSKFIGIQPRRVGYPVTLPLSAEEISKIKAIQAAEVAVFSKKTALKEKTIADFMAKVKRVELPGKFYREGTHTKLDSCEGVSFTILRHAENAWFGSSVAFSEGKFPFENPVKLVITGQETEEYNGFITDHGIVTKEFWYYE
jgi:hypothetical protein